MTDTGSHANHVAPAGPKVPLREAYATAWRAHASRSPKSRGLLYAYAFLFSAQCAVIGFALGGLGGALTALALVALLFAALLWRLGHKRARGLNRQKSRPVPRRPAPP